MENTKNIKVLVVEPLKAPYVKEIEHTLSALQHEVDGYIETFYPLCEEDMTIICNEESKLNGLPLNRAFYDNSGAIYEILCGTFLVVGLDGSDFCSLTDEQIEKSMQRFRTPELFFKNDNDIIAFPLEEIVSEKESTKENSDAINRTVEIYQLKDDDLVNIKMRFMSFSYMQKHQYPVVADKYNLVYSGSLSPDETLDQIYFRFNGGLGYFPENYKGHSLSVSDVIVIYENGKRKAYFVDSIGFLELYDFFN